MVLAWFRRYFEGRFDIGHEALMWFVCVFLSVFVQGGTKFEFFYHMASSLFHRFLHDPLHFRNV